MSKQRIVSFASALVMMLFGPVVAQPQSQKVEGARDQGDAPDVREILLHADQATKALRAVSYKSEFYGAGDLADQLSRVTGTVKTERRKSSLLGRITGDSPKLMLFIDAVERKPGADKTSSIKVATDGARVYRIDAERQCFTVGNVPGAEGLLGPVNRLLMLEYLHPTPFSDELNGKSAKYEGRKKIGGVDCYVVYVIYANGYESRWYFGTEDFLPRRVDRIGLKDRPDGKLKGDTVLVVTDLDTSPTLSRDDFKLECPKGFRKLPFSGMPSSLLPVGDEAPGWELKTPGGGSVALKDLRGSVVVMEFWSTTRGPCEVAMPGLQKLYKKFKDRPVRVFAVNCWESQSADPAAYLKSKDYTFELLLKGDKVAELYWVGALPTYYVIGPDGKILYASGGFLPDKEKEIGNVIEMALGEKATGKGESKEGDKEESKPGEEDTEEQP